MKTKKGFTLLELLLVIAIIVSLAGIILMALNPAQRLEEANEVKALATASDIEKAIKAYTVESGGILPTGLSSITQSGIYDICKSGETTGCINLDELVTGGKVSTIPEDERNSTTYTSGYKLSYNTTTTETRVYSHTEYEEAIKYCPPGDTCSGPVGEWLFNEGSGLTVFDTSGNNNNGTLLNGLVWTTGYEGEALQFDGVDDNINIPTSSAISSNTVTVSFWMKAPSQLSDWSIFFKKLPSVTGEAGWSVQRDGSSDALSVRVDTSTIFNQYGRAVIPSVFDNTWHYIAYIIDYETGTVSGYKDGNFISSSSYNKGNGVGNNGVNLYIGSGGALRAIIGLVDDVHIYNYTRTPAQIAWEYNQGAPVGDWKFDDATTGSGQVKIDSSENGNNGTTNSANGSGMNCTVDGRVGTGCSFDGVDDYISIPSFNYNIGGNFSISSWFKTSSSSQRPILSNRSGSGRLYYGIVSGKAFIYYSGSSPAGITSSTVINDDNWHNFIFVHSGNNSYLYIDGKLDSLYTQTGFAAFDSAIRIGHDVANVAEYFPGTLGEVKIFNYPLTSSQVMQAMHE